MEDADVTWLGATPDGMIAAGKGVRTDWANGAFLESEISGLADYLDPHDASVLVGAAAATFCPEYEAKVTGG